MDEGGEQFVRTLYPRVRGFLELHTGDAHLADELTQETLARVWARWSRVRHMTNPQGYAFRIAVNLSRSWFRRRVRERRALARLDTTGVSDEPATAERLATRAAMLALPRRQREVVLLRYFAGLDVAETAETMGCTAGTVKAHTHRAMARLREQLQVSEEPRP